MHTNLKISVLAALAMASLAVTSPACADVYLGGGAQFTAPFYVSGLEAVEPQHFGAGDLHAGLRVGQVAVEAGWMLASSQDGHHHLALSGLTLDALFFFPVKLAGAEPFLTAGTTNLLARSADISTSPSPTSWTVTTSPTFRAQNWDWCAGGGMEFRLSDHLRSRITARYQDFTFQQHMRGGVTFGVSLDLYLGGR